MQDGSAVFGATGLLEYHETGSPLHLSFELKGHHVDFDGEDFLGIDLDRGGRLRRFTAGKINSLKIDGTLVRP